MSTKITPTKNISLLDLSPKTTGQKDDRKIKYVLAFAIGAILGDIFFHLIPESINNHQIELSQSADTAHQRVGLSVVAGIFVFIIVEVMLLAEHGLKDKQDEQQPLTVVDENNNEVAIIDAAGYLSLIANGFDNFTHGLAIGASFLVSSKVGFLTAFVIFIHEIPHEICDYAILVNSGFTRWDAVKAQSSVSLFGILGTATSLYAKSIQALNSRTIWILPFSAGGFLYIALVNLLPEVLDRDTNLKNSMLQVACVVAGIAFMGAIAII